ncbi:MAG: alpha-ketoglutarate-dependent dioxygenase AlkB [Salibacteraceae bacterium]
MGELFDLPFDASHNLLPYDGEVFYHGKITQTGAADAFYRQLIENIEWRHDEAMMFGKRIITKRKVAWYGDHPYEYTYSKITKRALPWTNALQELKMLTEQQSGATYNSCLLNLYHDGSEGMSWHSDGETDLERHGSIASLSFGAQRKFAFKHRTSKETVNVVLEHGSMLVMRGSTQDHWLHRLPPTKKVHQARINLTFRTIITDPTNISFSATH